MIIIYSNYYINETLKQCIAVLKASKRDKSTDTLKLLGELLKAAFANV